MKRILLLMVSYLLFQSVKADDYSYLIVQKTDGTGVSLDVDQLSMTFSGGYLVAGDNQLAVSELSKMFFSNDESESQVGYELITISEAGQATYCSDKALNFKNLTSLKAYVATGYDKTTGIIWLTRVYKIPADTGFLLMGDAGDYHVPVDNSGSTSYYKNLFKGTLESMSLQTTDGSNTNYYLSNGTSGVGFYKATGDNGVGLGANRAYLSVPTDIPAVGTAGGTEKISVSAAKEMTYCSANSLDFTDVENVKAYTATGYDYQTGTIWLTRVKKVPAKTGILIMADEGDYSIPTASVASVYENMFEGTLTEMTIQTTETIDDMSYVNYYLSDGDYGVGFYKVTATDGVSISANHCYLPIPKQSSAGTRGIGDDSSHFGILKSDEVMALRLFANGTTGISTTQKNDGGMTNDNVFYNLQGQRVNNPGKGLYIRNGKKILVK